MSSRTVTIRDVAARAGVSESTVSRVLSGAKTRIPISEETRERVQQAARELRYRPHPGAQAMRGQSTHLLGLIVREVSDPWFAQIVELISDVAREKGYDLVLGSARSDPDEALALREMMLDLRYCDGLLLCGDLRESPEDHTFLARMGQDRRLVSISRGSKELVLNTPSVGVDNRQGATLAMEYLARLGHRRIACISAGRVGDLWERMIAYREFMGSRLGGSPDEYVRLCENSYQGGYDAVQELLSLPSPPTAVFATDDRIAIGALTAVLDMGRTVPGDLSIVGFDDMDFSAYVRPALTTVRQPMERIAAKAMELLLQMIDGQLVLDPVPQFLMEAELIVRDSCGPPPSGP